MLMARPVITRLVWCSALKANGMNRSLTVVTAFWVALTCAAAAKSTVHVPLPRNNPLKNTEQEEQQNSKPAMALFSEKKLLELPLSLMMQVSETIE
jgi:hypothetical protein